MMRVLREREECSCVDSRTQGGFTEQGCVKVDGRSLDLYNSELKGKGREQGQKGFGNKAYEDKR